MKTKLSYLAEKIQDAIQGICDGEYWVSAQVTNSKKYEGNKRCYLTLTEIENGTKVAEMKAVFWSTYYDEIAKFEKATGQEFKDGIEIVCKVKVRFNKVFGLTLEVFQIDIAHAIGSLEMQRRQTIEKLIAECICDKDYKTANNRLALPLAIKRIALITAPGSDGQRDFIQEITHNKHSYTFQIKEFLTTIQGDNAHQFILEQLKLVEQESFDVVAIVRGGGSQTDFKPFDDYELCKYVATFPVPIFTGIGHDRNQSLVDLMAREQKTPTKVAGVFIDHNFLFEEKLIEISNKISDLARLRIWNENTGLNDKKSKISNSAEKRLWRENTDLRNKQSKITNSAEKRLSSAKRKIEDISYDIADIAHKRLRYESERIKFYSIRNGNCISNAIKSSRKNIDDKKANIFRLASERISKSSQALASAKTIIKMSDPQNILNRGFAIVKRIDTGKLVTGNLPNSSELEITVKEGIILAVVNNELTNNSINEK